MKRETIREKLILLNNLTKSGNEHEAALARQKLEELAAKYGIGLAEISDRETQTAYFKYQTKMERKLILQIAYKVTGERRTKYWERGKNREVGLDLTRAHAAEIRFLYDHYRADYREKLEEFEQAYIHANRLFGTANGAERDLTPEEIKHLLRVLSMAENIDATSPLKRLGAASD